MNVQRWLALMERLQLPPAHETFDGLAQVYTADDRHYHNAEHIAHCLAELDAAASHIPQPDPLELALCFHDAVYDSHSASNEADSAQWAANFLNGCQAPPELTDTVVALILATRHQPDDLIPSAAWMVDIDLAILGSDPAHFAVYEQAIREEYAWVPEPIFREKRAAILRTFLERPALYTTTHFHRKYETQARLNLARSIFALESTFDIDRCADYLNEEMANGLAYQADL